MFWRTVLRSRRHAKAESSSNDSTNGMGNSNSHCRAFLKWSSMVKMRRVRALLLVFLFVFSLIGPAFFVDADSNLPACCRRNGKHRCGMMAETPSSGLSVHAPRTKCPLFPSGGTVLPHSGAALLTASQPAGAAIVGQIITRAKADAGYRVFLSSIELSGQQGSGWVLSPGSRWFHVAIRKR